MVAFHLHKLGSGMGSSHCVHWCECYFHLWHAAGRPAGLQTQGLMLSTQDTTSLGAATHQVCCREARVTLLNRQGAKSIIEDALLCCVREGLVDTTVETSRSGCLQHLFVATPVLHCCFDCLPAGRVGGHHSQGPPCCLQCCFFTSLLFCCCLLFCREGLVDTTVKTSRSGYLQRCFLPSLLSTIGSASAASFLFLQAGAC
jgi:hypothetical protein